MSTVTQRVSETHQPYGGYLPMKLFTKEQFDDGKILNVTENIHASIVGITVDYLTRFMMGDLPAKAFHISCLGASQIGMTSKANVLLLNITGLDDNSIVSACKLAGFDVCFRSSCSAYKPIEGINPDSATIDNIRIMVNRCITFWNKYGPVVCSEPTFQGGYTNTVSTGDGDFLTHDTLWDFKVSKSAPTSKHSLQVLMYYIMGLHSVHEEYQHITHLGFFNPRLNIAYTCPVSSISSEIITQVENEVICYDNSEVLQAPKKAKKAPATKYPDKFSISELCEITGLSKNIFYSAIRSGELHANKEGNKYYITKQSFLDYLDLLEYKKKQQQTRAAVSLIVSIVFVLVFIYLFTSILR